MINFNEELRCLFDYLEYCVINDAYNVLTDSTEDPQFSAVTTANAIKCYITIKQALGTPTPYHTIEEFLCDNDFSPDEIQLFNEKRATEAAYYHGKQF